MAMRCRMQTPMAMRCRAWASLWRLRRDGLNGLRRLRRDGLNGLWRLRRDGLNGLWRLRRDGLNGRWRLRRDGLREMASLHAASTIARKDEHLHLNTRFWRRLFASRSRLGAVVFFVMHAGAAASNRLVTRVVEGGVYTNRYILYRTISDNSTSSVENPSTSAHAGRCGTAVPLRPLPVTAYAPWWLVHAQCAYGVAREVCTSSISTHLKGLYTAVLSVTL